MPSLNDANAWRRLLFAGITISILIYLYLAFFRPWTLHPDPFAIQDDARDFLLWMPRLRDPRLLNQDLLADYWHSVSPWPYRLLFSGTANLGIDPLLFARILPVALLLATAALAWSVASRLTDRPYAAFLAAAFMLAFVLHDDSIFTSTPRGFFAPLFLLFLTGLLAERWLPLLAGLFLLAGFYPAPAIVAFGMLCLSRFRLRPRLGLDLSFRSSLLIGLAALLVAIAVFPLFVEAGRWGPTLTLAEARTMPTMMDPEGRSSLVDAGGGIGWLCSWRMGFVPAILPCRARFPGAELINLALFAPFLVLALGAVLGRQQERATQNRIYLLALVSAALCYAVAVMFAFKLHLPSRYSQRILAPLEWLAIGQLIGLGIEGLVRRPAGRSALRISAGASAVFLIASFVTPQPNIQRPRDPELIRFVRTLPPSSMIGGVSEELEFLPAETGRAALATPEHAIPYQLGYYRLIERRLRDSLEMVSTPDLFRLEALLVHNRMDFLLTERSTLANGTIRGRYAAVLPAETAAASERLKEGRSMLIRMAARCTIYRSDTMVMLSARCIREAADSASRGPASAVEQRRIEFS